MAGAETPGNGTGDGEQIPGPELEGFTKTRFTFQGDTRTIYRAGSGPGVVVMHEVPGITPTVADFARRVAAHGFTVAVPHLFGVPGKPPTAGYLARELAYSCINRDFKTLARHESSPITVWLRALCRELHAELGGPGVGAIGMCITGNFALALMLEPALIAPVLSQPSLPVTVSPAHAAALHVNAAELEACKRRCRDENLSVLAMRFTGDILCPGARFRTLERELGEAFEGIEIRSGPGSPHGIPLKAHSVVTEDLVDEEGHPTRVAVERVLRFFRERLKPADSGDSDASLAGSDGS